MRRSVAPVPLSDNSTTTEDKDTSPFDESFPQKQQMTTQPQFLAAMKRFGKTNVDSQANNGLDSESTAVTSTSVTMDDDDDGGKSIQVTDDDHHNPLDEISNASTEDPYTYSDDSASLSDAYFLQQPSLSEFAHHHPSASDYYGLLPLAYTSGERDARPNDDWAGPKSIQLGYDKLSEREQRRYRRLRNTTPLDEDPINENTSLLDSKPSPKVTQRDQNYYQTQVEELSAPKDSDGKSIASSYIHRQHRKKHQLRKFKRKILLEEQQRKQEERERAVSEVRGQPQPLSSNRDKFWLVLFLLQLFIVCSFAIKYGITFYDVSTSIDGESSTSASDDVASMAAASMVFWSDLDDTIPMTFKEDDALSDATSEVVQVKPFTIDYKNVLSLLAVAGIYACIISYLNFAFMLILARSIIQIMLVFSSFFLLCLAFFGLMVETNAGKIISLGGFAVFGMSFAYTMSNWNQIPLSSTNFHTAICAMRSSTGVLLVGMVSLFVALLWLLIWTIALMGTFNRNNSADCDVWDECETHVYIYKGRYIEMILLLISLYWTIFVIKNILRVAVAGAIGGPWWFAGMYNGAERIRQQQSLNGCCGWWSRSKVSDSILRACTTSLGTICFGSLVELPAQWLSKIVRFLCWLTGSYDKDLDPGLSSEQSTLVEKVSEKSDNNDDEELNNNSEGTHNADNLHSELQKQETSTALMYFGIFQEKLKRLDRTLQNCNRWSYTYIGMYNYPFYEGGEKAIQLFETREWMDIARDALIQNILLMASIVIGGSSGIVAVLVEEVDGYTFTSLHKPIMTAFLIGFFLGFILSNILLLGLAASAVNTVLVCFAAEPFAFDRNHPHLSREMREVWSQQVWEPNAVGV